MKVLPTARRAQRVLRDTCRDGTHADVARGLSHAHEAKPTAMTFRDGAAEVLVRPVLGAESAKKINLWFKLTIRIVDNLSY